MIRYALKCSHGHDFDSWFQSAVAFDRLSAVGMLSCMVCGDAAVVKSLMAPALRPDKPADTAADNRPLWSEPTQALALPGPAIEKAIAALRRQIEENSDYVGLDFAAEARAIHLGDAPERSIYGEARPEEARALIADGVPVAPLPFLPTRKSH